MKTSAFASPGFCSFFGAGSDLLATAVGRFAAAGGGGFAAVAAGLDSPGFGPALALAGAAGLASATTVSALGALHAFASARPAVERGPFFGFSAVAALAAAGVAAGFA